MIRTEERNGVHCLTIDRPSVNALDMETILALKQVYLDLAETESCKGIVLTGAGDCFCAGVDVKAFRSYSVEEKREMILEITRMTYAILSVRVPTVAAVNGAAMGGGMVLALCMDGRLSLTHSQPYWAMPEAKAGVPFPIGPLEIVRADLPASLQRPLMLHGRRYGPAELKDAGVVDDICRYKDLVKNGVAMCLELGAQPAYRAVKDQLRDPLRAAVRHWVDLKDDPLLRFIS